MTARLAGFARVHAPLAASGLRSNILGIKARIPPPTPAGARNLPSHPGAGARNPSTPAGGAK
ncbi:MAG: hypothetical protein K0U36_07060 [Alphaproteobacteria bacterium]|nr:hypothetical protein [Alphaproteobacteria bacterium]